MLISADIHMYLAEAATAATAGPCRPSFDWKLRSVNVQALAGRRAR